MTVRADYEIRAIDRTRAAFNSVRKNAGLVESGIKNLTRTLGLAVGVTGLGALVRTSLQSADELQKLSIRLGATAESMSRLRFVAEQSGVSFNTMTTGLQRMTRRVAEAARGTGEAKGAIAELGISAQHLVNLSLEDQFSRIADALSRVKNPADQVRLAMKLFDTEGVALVQTMQKGAKGIRELGEEAHRLGAVLTTDQVNAAAAANEAWNRLSRAMKGARDRIVIALAPALEALANFLSQDMPAAITFGVNALQKYSNVVREMQADLLETLADLWELGSALPIIGDRFKDLADTARLLSEVIRLRMQASMEQAERAANRFKFQVREVTQAERELTAVSAPAAAGIEQIAQSADRAAVSLARAAGSTGALTSGVSSFPAFGAPLGQFTAALHGRSDLFAGGTSSAHAPSALAQGERVVSNRVTFNGGINFSGGFPSDRSAVRRWVRDILIPEIQAATR